MVVDAGLAAKWVVNEEGTLVAVSLLERWASEKTVLAAPCLLPVEVTNALYKRVRREELKLGEAVALLNQLLDLGIALEDSGLLHQAVLELAARFELPATYDAYYLALAGSIECEFWTADERLFNTVKNHLGWVKYLNTQS